MGVMVKRDICEPVRRREAARRGRVEELSGSGVLGLMRARAGGVREDEIEMREQVHSVELRGDAGGWDEGYGRRVDVGTTRADPLLKVPFAGCDGGEDGGEGCATDVGVASPVCWTQERAGVREGGVRRVGDAQNRVKKGGLTYSKSASSSSCCACAADTGAGRGSRDLRRRPLRLLGGFAWVPWW